MYRYAMCASIEMLLSISISVGQCQLITQHHRHQLNMLHLRPTRLWTKINLHRLCCKEQQTTISKLLLLWLSIMDLSDQLSGQYDTKLVIVFYQIWSRTMNIIICCWETSDESHSTLKLENLILKFDLFCAAV